MEVVKKNLVSIIFGIVAILAVVALYYPISGWYEDLQKEVDSSVAIGSQIQAQINGARSMPILSPDQTTPEPLTVFPTQAVIEAGIRATQQVEKQANEMATVAKRINEHALILADELPHPDNPTRYNFAEQYQALTTNYAHWQKILNSGARPTPEEINAGLQQLHDKIVAERVRSYTTNPDGTRTPDPQSLADAEDEYNRRAVQFRPDMELKRAQSISVYLEPGALPYDNTITVSAGHEPPTPDRIWDAQLEFWTVDDVCNAVARCNARYSDTDDLGQPSHDVLHTPIKEVMHVDPPSPVMPTTPDQASQPPQALPAVSPTGRACNSLYDVVKYNVILAVDARKLTDVIREMEVGQFITVDNVQVTDVIDPAVAAYNGYRYGENPVIRVEITCEELFLRSWTNDLLPETRKVAFGGVTPPGGEAGAGGQASYNNAPTMGYNGGPPQFQMPQGGRQYPRYGGGPPPGYGGPPNGFRRGPQD